MNRRSATILSVILTFGAAFWPVQATAVQATRPTAIQGTTQAQTVGSVSAELVKGKLNPATSKPGDQVTARMKEDLKTDGQVVLKKGTEVTGIVRSVKRADNKTDTKSDSKGAASTQAAAQAAAQSVMQVEWLTPAGSGAAAQQLNFALQSIAYTNPLYAHQQQQESAVADAGLVALPPAPAGGRPTGGGGGLVGGVVGTAGGVVGASTSALGATGNAGGSIVAGTGAIAGGGAASAGAAGQGGAGLLAGPKLIPASSQTAAALQNNFGVSGSSLFQAGRGSAVSSGGTTNSMDLFTHMANDTIITSPSRDFEVGTGAQMQFLVNAKAKSQK